MAPNKTSPKFSEARESLPEALRPVYDQLVEDYAFFATKHYGRPYVAYRVIAALVLQGWKPADGNLTRGRKQQ